MQTPFAVSYHPDSDKTAAGGRVNTPVPLPHIESWEKPLTTCNVQVQYREVLYLHLGKERNGGWH